MFVIFHRQTLTYILLIALQAHLTLSSQYCGASACVPTCQAPGSACNSEGLWNCLTHSWQRCANGVWSVAMPCAEGTACEPAGLTNDMQILGEDERSDGFSSSSGLPSTHYGTYAAGGMLVKVHEGFALAAFLVYTLAIAV